MGPYKVERLVGGQWVHVDYCETYVRARDLVRATVQGGLRSQTQAARVLMFQEGGGLESVLELPVESEGAAGV